LPNYSLSDSDRGSEKTGHVPASFGKMRRDEGTIDRVGIGRSGEKEKKR
jgi:hypothetical protein